MSPEWQEVVIALSDYEEIVDDFGNRTHVWTGVSSVVTQLRFDIPNSILDDAGMPWLNEGAALEGVSLEIDYIAVTDSRVPADVPFTTNPGFDECETHPADINGDGDLDSLDVQKIINAALGIAQADKTVAGDLCEDGRIDAAGVQCVINAVLGVSVFEEIPEPDPTVPEFPTGG